MLVSLKLLLHLTLDCCCWLYHSYLHFENKISIPCTWTWCSSSPQWCWKPPSWCRSPTFATEKRSLRDTVHCEFWVTLHVRNYQPSKNKGAYQRRSCTREQGSSLVHIWCHKFMMFELTWKRQMSPAGLHDNDDDNDGTMIRICAPRVP